MNDNPFTLLFVVLGAAALGAAAVVVLKSLVSIGAAEVGLVTKRFGRKLSESEFIAFDGEAGYQSELLMPGLRFKLWPVFSVSRHPWVQVPAGEIGVVIAQAGAALPVGAKSAAYNPALGQFNDLRAFIDNGGEKGVQRPVLPPGTLLPIHPAAFVVLTASDVFGVPASPELQQTAEAGLLVPESFGLAADALTVTVIAPAAGQDYVGVVTALEGDPLPKGDIAARLGGYEDVREQEAAGAADAEIVEMLLSNKNELHNNYQDFQRFIDAGGKIGLQHDPLMYGAYLLNPFLIKVEMVPMLVVNQGQVAVMKSFVGLPTVDTSGQEFKFGSIVAPGHRGIWREPLRTGKYPLNPRCYSAEVVPTSIITLNWADATSAAHNLDAHLSSIVGKSREGFVFNIDLQVQIHVPDTRAPKVISMVGTMQNLVNEVLQSAVGNHFRNTLQQLEAIRFIETRHEVQAAAFTAVSQYLAQYEVETKGVYIQDVTFPEDIVQVLTSREIANQEKITFEEQRRAQEARVTMERAKGTADMQAQLATSEVGIEIKRNEADSKKAEAEGDAGALVAMGNAEASRRVALAEADAQATKAVGLAEADALRARGEAEANTARVVGEGRADGYMAQVEALGQGGTAMVNVVDTIARGGIKITPDVLVGSGSTMDGLMAALTRAVTDGTLVLPGLGGAPADAAEVPEGAGGPAAGDMAGTKTAGGPADVGGPWNTEPLEG